MVNTISDPNKIDKQYGGDIWVDSQKVREWLEISWLDFEWSLVVGLLLELLILAAKVNLYFCSRINFVLARCTEFFAVSLLLCFHLHHDILVVICSS